MTSPLLLYIYFFAGPVLAVAVTIYIVLAFVRNPGDRSPTNASAAAPAPTSDKNSGAAE